MGKPIAVYAIVMGVFLLLAAIKNPSFLVFLLPVWIIVAVIGLAKKRPDAMSQNIENLFAQMDDSQNRRGNPPSRYQQSRAQMPPRQPLGNAAEPRYRQPEAPRFTFSPTDESYDDYSDDFQREYYHALSKGRDLEPWELTPEKAPWER